MQTFSTPKIYKASYHSNQFSATSLISRYSLPEDDYLSPSGMPTHSDDSKEASYRHHPRHESSDVGSLFEWTNLAAVQIDDQEMTDNNFVPVNFAANNEQEHLPVAAALFEDPTVMRLFSDRYSTSEEDTSQNEAEYIATSSYSNNAMDIDDNTQLSQKMPAVLVPQEERHSEEVPSVDKKVRSRQKRPLRAYQCEQWTERFQELCHFKRMNGHTNVPHNYRHNPSLARWIKRQRHQHRLMKEGQPSTMTWQRIQALEGIGFVWDVYGDVWEQRLEELRAFKVKYNSCDVPCNFPENQGLAIWVKCQRRQYKLYLEIQEEEELQQGDNASARSSSMTPGRIRALEELGFRWGLRNYKKRIASRQKDI